MQEDRDYIQRAVELAKLGRGQVSPNPLVGAVIVYNGKIIGEGYHQRYGEPHAEVNAVNSVNNTALLNESTIYVTLEPCAHFGKTPPCADLIVKHQFKRVVIGSQDPFAKVNGAGIKRIENAGISVELLNNQDCIDLNQFFFTYHEKKRPFVLLKWAQSSNGKITAPEKWISQPESQVIVHQLRADYDAILVGKNTVINDNPSLTTRRVSGKHPIRIILDSNLSLTADYSIFNNEVKTIILNTKTDKSRENTKWLKIDNMEPKTILSQLYQEGIQSVLIEGGKQTLESFITTKNWDKTIVIQNNKTVSEGIQAPQISGHLINRKTYLQDTITETVNTL